MPVNKLGTTQAAIRGKIAETAETITKESLVKPALEHFGSKVGEKMFSANLQKANILRKLSGDAQTKIFSSQTIKFDSSVMRHRRNKLTKHLPGFSNMERLCKRRLFKGFKTPKY